MVDDAVKLFYSEKSKRITSDPNECTNKEYGCFRQEQEEDAVFELPF